MTPAATLPWRMQFCIWPTVAASCCPMMMGAGALGFCFVVAASTACSLATCVRLSPHHDSRTMPGARDLRDTTVRVDAGGRAYLASALLVGVFTHSWSYRTRVTDAKVERAAAPTTPPHIIDNRTVKLAGVPTWAGDLSAFLPRAALTHRSSSLGAAFHVLN